MEIDCYYAPRSGLKFKPIKENLCAIYSLVTTGPVIKRLSKYLVSYIYIYIRKSQNVSITPFITEEQRYLF